MEKTLRRANDRGSLEAGWLHARYSFSFGDYYDENNMGFGALRVLNDDTIEASGGFGMHPHSDMEIITIPLAGSVKHEDSMGNSGIIKSGEIQRMSAGSGILHSEHNASDKEKLSLLQIWIHPKEKGISPSYEQRAIIWEKNALSLIISPSEETVFINQDAYLSVSELDADHSLSYKLRGENGVYVFVISGSVRVGGEDLTDRDAVSITSTGSFSVKANKKSKVLFIEVPL